MEDIQEKNVKHIHWYPGHIAKAERALKEKINLVDVVIEVLDARVPLSSSYGDIKSLISEKPRLILLNKSDLTDKEELLKWKKYISETYNVPVIVFDAKQNPNTKQVISKAIELAEPRIQQLMKKGLLRRPARVVVVGMPNVGKSSIINKLTKSSKTKVGAKAGVTRQQQWVRINPKLELLDTPGIIPMKQDNQMKALKLAIISSVSDSTYDSEDVSVKLLSILNEKYCDEVKSFYKIEDKELSLENIALSRNWIVKGGQMDIQRTSNTILSDFRQGKIGRFILDEFPV